MSNLNDIGNLMHLYMNKIKPGERIDAPEFLVKATAKILNKSGSRNWGTYYCSRNW